MSDQTDRFRYRAFISYSQADKALARRLHRALEAYRVPKGIAGGRKLGRVFRDDEELAGAASLGATLEAALQETESLIVLCTPKAAASKWVDAEIRHFRRARDAGRVFAVIAGGEPNASASGDPKRARRECFAPALRGLTPEGAPDPERFAEPFAPDLTKEGFARTRTRLVAGLLGVAFDDLWDRQKRRTRALVMGWSAAAVVFVAAAGGLASWTGFDASRRGWSDSLVERAEAAVIAAEAAFEAGQAAFASGAELDAEAAARARAAALTLAAAAVAPDSARVRSLMDRVGYVTTARRPGVGVSAVVAPDPEWRRALVSFSRPGDADGSWSLVDLRTGADVAGAGEAWPRFGLREPVDRIHGRLAGRRDQEIVVWSAAGEARGPAWRAPALGVTTALAFTADGARLGALGDEGFRQFDAASGEPLQWSTLPGGVERGGRPGLYFDFGFAHDGRGAYAVDSLGGLWRWSAQTQAWTAIETHAAGVDSLVIAPHGDALIASRSDGGGVQVFDGPSGKALFDVSPWDCATATIEDCPLILQGFSADGRFVVMSRGRAQDIRVWSIEPGASPRRLAIPDCDASSAADLDVCGFSAVALSPSEPRLASVGSDGLARVWRLDTLEEALRIETAGAMSFGAAYSGDGRVLLISSQGAGVGLGGVFDAYDAADGRRLARRGGAEPTGLRVLAVDQTGARVAILVGGLDPALEIWTSLGPGRPAGAGQARQAACADVAPGAFAIDAADRAADPRLAARPADPCAWRTSRRR